MNDLPPPLDTSSSTLDFTCSRCGRTLRVPAAAVGRTARCPECGTEQTVPAPPPSPAAADRETANEPRLVPERPEQQARTGDAEVGPAATAAENPNAARDTPTRRLFERLQDEIGKVFVGQHELVLGTLVALFSGGHVLIESVPGLGKTLLVRTLARVLGCRFGRIQFTADLMPSDITGAPM